MFDDKIFIFFLHQQGERATGYGVALLNVLFSQHIRSNMLNSMAIVDKSTDRNGSNSVEYMNSSQGNSTKKQRIQ